MRKNVFGVGLLGVLLTGAVVPSTAQTRVGTLIASELKNHHADLTSVVNSSNVKQMRLVWKIDTEEEVSHMPLVHRGNVFFADWGGNVYKVDARSGKVIWKKKVAEKVMEKWPWYGFAGTGAVVEPLNLLVEASVEGMAYGIDTNTGQVKWSTRIADDPQAGSLAKITYYDGLVYLGLQSVWKSHFQR